MGISLSSSLTEFGRMYMKRREPQTIKTKCDAQVDKAFLLPSLDFLFENCENDVLVRDYYYGNSKGLN